MPAAGKQGLRVTLHVPPGQATRYLAYSSDVGEAFRPVVPPAMVNASYAVAVGYACAASAAFQACEPAHRACAGAQARLGGHSGLANAYCC
jgi:hypothetical protein